MTMIAFFIEIGIWKATEGGKRGWSALSMSKTINRSSEGSTVPKADSRVFFYVGHV